MENEYELTYKVKLRNKEVQEVSDSFIDTHLKLVGINNVEWIEKDKLRSYNNNCGVCGRLHGRP